MLKIYIANLGKNDTLCYLDINMFSIRSKMKNL